MTFSLDDKVVLVTGGTGSFGRKFVETVLARHRAQFADIPLFTIEEKFGSWKKANDTHFAEGGVFDQLYKK